MENDSPQNIENQTSDTDNQPDNNLAPNPEKKSRKKPIITLVVLIIILLGVVVYGLWNHYHHSQPVATASQTSANTSTSKTSPEIQALQLDSNKNYGNKYKDGILPVGDGKYTTNAPKKGYVYACSQYAQVLANKNGGAMTRGPWFSSDGKTWNITKKINVNGVVYWRGSMTDTVSGDTRTIVSDDLPLVNPTGTFPIAGSDPAYQYDRNPNSIDSQSFTYSLSANPTYGANPTCEGGQVGVMLSGVALFNALDAGGRDAGAWEVQDGCQGHPQSDGIYHYHTLSSCIRNRSVHDVIGFALDGFPITGPNVGTNNVLTTSDLDECHGIVSSYSLDGKTITGYHYVMTEDFPYSVSCYRGTPITPPGQNHNQQHPPSQKQAARP